MRISVITPCLNAAAHIEKAIASVLAQNDSGVEHIIVDGGSTDGTLEIVARYSQVRCVSGPDRNQTHAMNKGFALATGDIIVYLNADDYFYAGTFAKVRKAFGPKIDMVMGRVEVLQERMGSDGDIETQSWINDPRCDVHSILRHWEPNAFCVNPVGYFYKRHVQEAIPFEEKHGPKMDMAFLLAVAERFSIIRIDHVCGCFSYTRDTQTAKEQCIPSYWNNNNFPFITETSERILEPKALRQFGHDRDRGYWQRRHETARRALAEGKAEELMTQNEVFFLPQTEMEIEGLFLEAKYMATKFDHVYLVVGHGKVGSKSLTAMLHSLWEQGHIAIPPYHFHNMNLVNIENVMKMDFLPPFTCIDEYFGRNWKYLLDKGIKFRMVMGVRDPIVAALSGKYEILSWDDYAHSCPEFEVLVNCILNWFDINMKVSHGIDIFSSNFNKEKGYVILRYGECEILLYTLESLPSIIGEAMEDFLGIANLQLPKVNMAEDKSYSCAYKNEVTTTKYSREFLDSVYSSKYVQHFYTEDQISLFYEKWESVQSTNNTDNIYAANDMPTFT